MKHNKWYTIKGDKNIEIPKHSLTIECGILSNTNLSTKQIGNVEKTAENTMPQGSSDCLYTRDTTFTNFVFLILVVEHLLRLNQAKGTIIYTEANKARNALPLSGKINCTPQAAINASPAENNIFTLFKVQKPDFSTTGEFGDFLLKNAIAFALLESILGFFIRLLGNIFYLLVSKATKYFIYYNTTSRTESL